MTSNNMPSFGASIVPAPTENTTMLSPQPETDSPALTPAVSHNDFLEKPHPPNSPFYQHPPASHERVSTTVPRAVHKQDSSNNLAVFEKDLESAPVTPLTTRANEENPFTSKVSVDANKECTMWPSRQTLMQKHLAEKRRKRDKRWCGCGPLRHQWATYTKKQKLSIHIGIAIVLIGIIVAIGVGISAAVHGGVYDGDGTSHQVGETT